jgi:hypothetical protein
MLMPFAFQQSGTVVAPWTPLSLGNTVLYGWYKSDAGLTVSTDGASVATWADQSTNNKNLSQSTPANRPVFRTAANGINGIPVLEFPSSSTTPAFFNETAFPANTNGFSFYIVSRNAAYSASAQYAGAFAIGDTSAGSINQFCNVPGATTTQALRVNGASDFGASAISSNFTVTKVSRAAALTSLKYQTTYTPLQLYSNTNTFAIQPGFWIGKNYIGSVGGKIAEVIVCNRELTGDEEIKLNTYLRSRYGFDLNYGADLPVTGAALWLDGSRWDKLYSDAGTLLVTADNGAIQQANDLSGNGLNATQATLGIRPTYRAPVNGVNGLSAIQHSSTGWYFTTASASLGEYTALSVMTSGWAGANYRAVFGHNYNSSTAIGQAMMATGSTLQDWQPNYLLATGNGYPSTNNPRALGPHGGLASQSAQQITARVGSANSTVRLNGNPVTSLATNAAITPSSAAYYIGNSGPLNDYHDGKTCETIIYPRLLTDAEIVLVENYLKKKWATQNTILLLSMDGANGSTNFVDSGPNALAVTAVGNAQISTAQSKYGGASGYFDGSGDYLALVSNSQLAVGTSDFTIEFWIYITARKAYGYIINTQGGTNSLYISFDLAGNFLRLTNDTTIFAVTSTLNLNQWYHVAVVRSSGSSKIHVDGIGGTAVACAVSFVQGGPLIGGTSIANYFQGYFDDLRISKKAWYTGNFTPPSTPHISD